MPSAQVHGERERYLDEPYPEGESWRQAVARAGRFLPDLREFSKGSPLRVLVIGHIATRWALDYFLKEIPLENLARAEFEWQEGWEYRL